MIKSNYRIVAILNTVLAALVLSLSACVWDTTTYHLSNSKKEARKDGLLIASYTPYSSIDSLVITEAWVQKGYYNNKDFTKEIGKEFDLCFNIESESSDFFSRQNYCAENGFSFQHIGYRGGFNKGVYN